MQREQPTFRFHGQKQPTANRAPVKAVVNRANATAATSGQSADVATIRLYDPIDSWGGDWGVSAKEFAAALDTIPDVSEIRLHINSPGGEVWEALAIMNQLRNHPANVTAVVDGLAASAASFIAVSADTTIMAPNSQMMIHDALGIMIGNAADMTEFAAFLDSISQNVADIYATKTGKPVSVMRSAMLAETWYTADEAAAIGLVDTVDAAPADEQPTDRFDLTIYQYAGRDKAPAPVLPAVTDASDVKQSPDEVAAVIAAQQRRTDLYRRKAEAA